MKVTIELAERFHEKWILNNRTGCWDWIGAVAGKGYGFLKKPGERRQVYAHRLSWLIHYGDIPEGLSVCHACDNMRCVKPSHLFVGTQSDNLNDMKAKDRHLHGSRNKMAKLDDHQVRHIHRLSSEGVSQGDLARTYRVGQGTIWKILHGERYADIYREIKATAK